MIFLLLFLSFLPLQNTALSQSAKEDYQTMENEMYYSGEYLKKWTGIDFFYDKSTDRGVLERNDEHRAVFLANSRFVTFQGRFFQLKRPVIAKNNTLYFSLSALRDELRDLILQEKLVTLPTKMPPANRSRCAIQREIKRIVLDPGHGGIDFGAARDRVLEKDVVLRFSQMAAKELQAKGFEVKLTRKKDVFIPLEVRPAMALSWNADVFISIHANSFATKNARGTETYILNRDASSDAARKLAIQENAQSMQKQKAGPAEELADKGTQETKPSKEVADILWDMEQNAFLQDSAYLASNVHNSILADVNRYLRQKQPADRWKNRGVLQAPFMVLSQASMPAILLELGFLSNAQDRSLLTDSQVQSLMAKAVAKGVQAFADYCKVKSATVK